MNSESLETMSEALQIALEETLSKATGVPMYLTGGTSAALYSGKTIRPLSFDLDFMILHDPSKPGVHAERLKGLFDVDFVRFSQKKTFKSMKAVGEAGNGCDLDFIVDQQVMPNEEDPDMSMTLFVSTRMLDRVQTKEFEGVPVQVVPPEYVVLAKLFAGRGLDIGKYDLADSAAIMNNFESNQFNAATLLEDLEAYLGATNPEKHSAVKQRIAESLKRIMDDTESHGLTREVYAMISRIYDSLTQ